MIFAKKKKKTPREKRKKKGDKLICKECGLVVTVDEVCDCVEACDLVCCGQEMQSKK